MAGNDLRIVYIKTGKLCTLGRYILMACSMETITTDTIFFIILIWKAIHICI